MCGFITPWNWPINQVMCKVMPALAAGCTMVLKPSEITPLNAMILAEIFDKAGVPAGVFNLVNGDGPTVGAAIASHPGVDMVSFTGSTRAGVQVAKNAADTVKRVTQELGGKSANIILEDADIAKAVSRGVQACFQNSGQSCNAPTRMFVPAAKHAEALKVAKQAAEKVVPGDPASDAMVLGPVASKMQFDKIQGLIGKGVEEGAELVCGGPGRPQGLEKGYFVKPTVFGNVRNNMTIAREEIFGPVLCILPYQSEEEAVAMANDTPYGLSGYVQSGDVQHAVKVAARLRTGNVHINGAGPDFAAPFGGYKQSGNGREWGEWLRRVPRDQGGARLPAELRKRRSLRACGPTHGPRAAASWFVGRVSCPICCVEHFEPESFLPTRDQRVRPRRTWMTWMRSAMAVLVMLATAVAGAEAQEMTLSVAVSLKEAIEDSGRASREPAGLDAALQLRGVRRPAEADRGRGAHRPVPVRRQRQMDELEKKNLIVTASRRSFARNVLTVIKPADSRIDVSKPPIWPIRASSESSSAIRRPFPSASTPRRA